MWTRRPTMPSRRRKRYHWLILADGARWPRGPEGQRLLTRLNRVGRTLKRQIRIDSGRRTNYEQWVAYMDFLSGGNLAAPCCWKHWAHPWSQCARQCASNHCINRAADCSVQARRSGTVFHSIGDDPQARKAMRVWGLCLPVGSGETWHVEVGNAWNS